MQHWDNLWDNLALFVYVYACLSLCRCHSQTQQRECRLMLINIIFMVVIRTDPSF